MKTLFLKIHVLAFLSFRRCLASLSLVLLLTTAGCDGQVDGGEQTIFESPSVLPSGIGFRVNNETGSDSADGVSQPFQSLQHALDNLRPGDTLIIENTSTPYSSNAVIGEELDQQGDVSRILQGFVLRNGGSPDRPITLQGERLDDDNQPLPVIDQQQVTSSPGVAILGLYLPCVSHVVVRDLEIRNTNEAGISSATDGGCETSNLVIENNHIHDVYGEKYVGGIRMMGVSDLFIRNNLIEDIFSNQTAEQKVLLKTAGGQRNIVIENNRLENLQVGVAINAQALDVSATTVNDTLSITDIKVANNSFSNLTDTAIVLQTHISDQLGLNQFNTGFFRRADIYGNVFDQIESTLTVNTNPSLQASTDLCFYNNTVVNNTLAALDINSVDGLEFFNNLFYRPLGDIIVTRPAISAAQQNSISYSDNNLFAQAALGWQLDAGGLTETLFADAQSWMTASHPQLITMPDTNSIFGQDPAFVDVANANYGLLSNSPALSAGRFGMSIGADFSLPDNLPGSSNGVNSACIDRLLQASP